jgi:hypothetical protein
MIAFRRSLIWRLHASLNSCFSSAGHGLNPHRPSMVKGSSSFDSHILIWSSSMRWPPPQPLMRTINMEISARTDGISMASNSLPDVHSSIFSTSDIITESISFASWSKNQLFPLNGVNLGFMILPNVLGQTCGPCAIEFMGSLNRIVCSHWLGSVVFIFRPLKCLLGLEELKRLIFRHTHFLKWSLVSHVLRPNLRRERHRRLG